MQLGVLFSAGNDLPARLIRWTTRSDWNHVALVNLTDGHLIEAQADGVRGRHWRPTQIDPAYRETLHVLDTLDPADAQRGWVWALEQVGRFYGWLGVVSIGLRLVTGLPVGLEGFREGGELTCGELVAVALLVAGRPFPGGGGPVGVTPGDLAQWLLGGRRLRDVVTVRGEA